MKFKSLFFLSLILLSTHLHAQDVDHIIKKYIDYVGGEKKWKKINSITTAGEYDYGGMKFPFTAYAKAPNLYKFIVPFNGKYYAQAFDGTKGWKIDAFKNETKPTLLTGRDALAMANEADVELINVFIDYKDKGHSLILDGKDSVLHHLCYKIKLTRKTGEVETYFINTKTFSLEMKVAVSKNVEMNGAELHTFYSDYRDVDGIKMAFKAESKIGDQSVFTIIVSTAKLNSTIDDKEFAPMHSPD